MFGIDTVIIYSILVLGAIGLIFGLGLGLAAKKFAVAADPREEEILHKLAGANCGACGYPGCAGYAAALAKGEAEPGKCPLISSAASKEIAGILGKTAADTEPQAAVILCDGGKNCKNAMVYEGIKDCRIAETTFGGPKECRQGCFGYGTCAAACPFDAIKDKGPGNVPEIDWSKCTGCGLCVAACPRGIIRLVPRRFQYHILCRSLDKGARVKQICPPGCIGCGICVKACPEKDIVLENNLARMKYDKCTNCGICLQKCPAKTIKRFGGR